MNFKKLYLLAWASSCSLISLEALAQTDKSVTAEMLEILQPQTRQTKLLNNPNTDSVKIAQYSDVAYDLFLSYWEHIAPVEIQGFTNENGVAEAQEFISEDLFFTPNPDIVQVSQKVSYKHVPYVSDEVIATRLGDMSQTISFRFNDEVRGFVDYMSIKRRQYALAMLKRKNLYFPLFEKHLKEYGIPEELKYLAIVESALKPTAVSRAGAGGLWQFMPGTGKIYGLERNAYVDERMDPEKATIAACKYLKALNKFFDGDWELALAAYNCGPGRIQKAQRRSGKKGFWEIYSHLPKETRSYVPMFVAVAYTLTYAEDHNIIQNEPLYPIESAVVYVNQHLNLESFAKEINVCTEDLLELNPELRKGVVPANFKNYPLRIPAARLPYFNENQESILASSQGKKNKYASVSIDKNFVDESENNAPKTSRSESSVTTKTTYHTVRRGESLGTISKKYKTSIAALKKLNGLRNDKIHAGSKLVVKGERTVVVAKKEKVQQQEPQVSTVAYKAEVQENRTTTTSGQLYHTIKRGESLGIISRKYKVAIADLKKLNGLSSNKIHAGNKILIKGNTPVVVQKAAISLPKTVAAKVSPKKESKPKKQHTVQNGDSLWKIAQKYGTSIEKIKSENRLASDKLDLGQVLKISK